MFWGSAESMILGTIFELQERIIKHESDIYYDESDVLDFRFHTGSDFDNSNFYGLLKMSSTIIMLVRVDESAPETKLSNKRSK